MQYKHLVLVDRYFGGGLLLLLKPFVYAWGKLFKPNHHLILKKELLIIKLLGAGSLYIALSNLIALKYRYPHIKLKLLATASVKAFVEPLNIFDEIIVIELNRGMFSAFKSTFTALIKLFKTDTTIDLEAHSRFTVLLPLLILSRNRVAFSVDNFFWKRKLSTHLIYFSNTAPVYEYYNQIFSLWDVAPVDRSTELAYLVKQGFMITGDRDQQLQNRLVAIGFSCSGNTIERELTPSQWVDVFERYCHLPEGAQVQLLGAPGDFQKGEVLRNSLAKRFPNFEFINKCGAYSPVEVIKLIARTNLFVGIDSLLLHIAYATGVSTVSFWGPSDPRTRLRYMNFEQNHSKVYYQQSLCSPCVHGLIEAPCQGDNICIKNLFVTDSGKNLKKIWLVHS